MIPKPEGQCQLWVALNSYGSVSCDEHRKRHTKVLYSIDPESLQLSAHSLTFSLGEGGAFHSSFPTPCVSTYLFIIVDMSFSLHSNGHWIMTFHMDLLNRILGNEVFKKEGGNTPSLTPS